MFVLQLLPSDLVDRIRRWEELKRWERREIGWELRRLGLSYKEIALVIPVSKGTLSGWCRELDMTSAEKTHLLDRQTELIVDGRYLKKRRHIAWERADAIRVAAREEASGLRDDADWVAGAIAYWAEGSKRQRQLGFSNSDPALVRLFLTWCERFLAITSDRFTVRLHLHAGQEEQERREFWSTELGIPLTQFRKAFIKPEGSGHRKNVLYNGTAQIRVRRSTGDKHRVLGWIDALRATPADLR